MWIEGEKEFWEVHDVMFEIFMEEPDYSELHGGEGG